MAAPHSPSMAPRYVPKRGQVMKNSLKKIFGLCFGNKSMISHSLPARSELSSRLCFRRECLKSHEATLVGTWDQ
ncbi:hypothetical protein NC653_025094 [Populus alba x Populus x berolinensis]|uniref:Uncharacterized protein n=1 Tax=Populus alba x Populus x berolinensis TaxID=444605 RepID=A0AAD6Q7K6_9ROSI|nr:hypothetical protein NC653_025094 [Populus alba x Populus x berolinensis]